MRQKPLRGDLEGALARLGGIVRQRTVYVALR
jgi:hypothetical protein